MLSASIQVVSIIGLVVMGIVLVLGIVLMAVRRRDHGRAAVIGILGCVAHLLGAMYSIVLQGVLIGTLEDLLDLGAAFAISNAISLFFSVLGTGLLIWAVVARRNPRQAAPPAVPGWPGQPQPHWNQPQQPGWGHVQQPPFQQHPGVQNPPHPPQG